jgi:hypothetical protein
MRHTRENEWQIQQLITMRNIVDRSREVFQPFATHGESGLLCERPNDLLSIVICPGSELNHVKKMFEAGRSDPSKIDLFNRHEQKATDRSQGGQQFLKVFRSREKCELIDGASVRQTTSVRKVVLIRKRLKRSIKSNHSDWFCRNGWKSKGHRRGLGWLFCSLT